MSEIADRDHVDAGFGDRHHGAFVDAARGFGNRAAFHELEALAHLVQVHVVDKRAITEASGGVNESTIVAIAETGVDVISVGDLTHTVKAVDISLDVKDIKPSALRTIERLKAAG